MSPEALILYSKHMIYFGYDLPLLVHDFAENPVSLWHSDWLQLLLLVFLKSTSALITSWTLCKYRDVTLTTNIPCPSLQPLLCPGREWGVGDGLQFWAYAAPGWQHQPLPFSLVQSSKFLDRVCQQFKSGISMAHNSEMTASLMRLSLRLQLPPLNSIM